MDKPTRKYSFHVDGAESAAGRPEKFLKVFSAVLEFSNYGPALDSYARLCSRCGRCASECPLHELTGEGRDSPCARSQMLLRIYQRYFTGFGSLRSMLPGGFVLTNEYLDEMAEAYYRCTACRRCKEACPMGVDHGIVTHLGRWLLAESGIAPKALAVAVRQQLEGIGNTSGIPVPALKDTLEFLEDDFRDLYGGTIHFPLDVENAEYIFFTAVSDYLLEPDALMSLAAVMRLTGGSWTIGTQNFDGINYGLFYSDRFMERILGNVAAEARRLNAKRILVGECGHATRSAWLLPSFAGPSAPPVTSVLEYAHNAIVSGKLPLKGKVIEERVTYHDPCNMARAGRITEPPREILKAICRDFVEMTPNRTRNYCCGGGSGTVSMDELREFRTKQMGHRKAEQIRATGAQYVVAPCANCKKQLKEVCEDNGLEGVTVVGVYDLLLKAMDLSGLAASPAEGSVA